MADASPPAAGRARAPSRRRPSRRALAAIVVPLVTLVVLGYVGDASAATLVDRHPAWLIALNARNRNLALATNYLDAWTYYGIGTWGQLLRQGEKWFGKAAYPLIFVAPNNPICLFAGAAGMPLRAFFAVNLAGTLTRLYLIRLFGDAFEAPIDDFVGWIGDNRLPLLALSVALVVLSIVLEARRGETEVESLVHLDDELDDAERELERRRADGPDGGDRAEDADDATGDR
jgi:hypothetical protein